MFTTCIQFKEWTTVPRNKYKNVRNKFTINNSGKSDNARWTNGESILSEIGSVQLEFKRLAEITSDADLYKKMSDTIAFIHKKQEEAYKEDPISIPRGLYPVLSNIDTGAMSSNARITFGGLADSFYECTCLYLY